MMSIDDYYSNLPKIQFKFGTSEPTDYVNKKERDTLLGIKNKIDNSPIKEWDRAKKLTNPYELIYIPSRKMKHESIANYEPLSRSYFKMWEMIHKHGLISNKFINKPMSIVNIAEGPGGFIEALVNYRKFYNHQRDSINAITLRSVNRDIPGWDKAYNFIKENTNVNIHYGADNTGNIYNVDNIRHFRHTIKSYDNADIITADGGFDYSNNFNDQEYSSLRIIFCEVILALTVQNLGGHFVCKFFDLYSLQTIKLIYILKCSYSTVIIEKPNTSRPANSEKYIICKDFMGIDDYYLDKLLVLVKSYSIANDNGYKVESLFDPEWILPEVFLNNIIAINTNHFNLQKDSIHKTLDIIRNKPNLTTLNKLLNQQVLCAVKWCHTYEIQVNYLSTFIDKKQ
jgi:23S rRNA U2552 (ribose-2'-O)-methylase RlmE/FtsJ